MATTYVKSIHAEGIFGRFDIDQKFEEGINIIYGKNGAGKTTLLHILANALSGNFERFEHFDFRTIIIKLSNKQTLSIIKREEKGVKTSIEVTLNKRKIYPELSNIEFINFFTKNLNFHEPSTKKELLSLVEILNESTNRNEQIDFLQEFINNNSSFELLSGSERSRIVNQIYSRLNREEKNSASLLSIAYFPAFRTMIEAWAATNLAKESRNIRNTSKINTEEWKRKATEQARDWFGEFIPTVNFPSLVDIEDQLTSEILNARITVGNQDRDLLSEAFLKVFISLSDQTILTEKSNDILKQIRELFTLLESSPMGITSTPIYRDLRKELSKLHTQEGVLEPSAVRILMIYRDVLKSSLLTQQSLFENIEKYIRSVNEFLEDKKSLAYKLDIASNRQSWLGVKFDDGSFNPGLRTLSSGERQITTLIYASTHMSKQDIVLIDEPEISLHIDWQRKLISKMAEQIGDRQIIACTHSPVIAADYQERMKEFQFKPSRNKKGLIVENDDQGEN